MHARATFQSVNGDEFTGNINFKRPVSMVFGGKAFFVSKD